MTVKRYITLLIYLSALMAVTLMAIYVVAYRYWHLPQPLNYDHVLEVKSGMSVTALIADLKRIGVVENETKVKFCRRIFDANSIIRRGEYELPKKASLAQLFALFATGATKQYSVTFIEGQTLLDFSEELSRHRGVIKNDDASDDVVKLFVELLSTGAAQIIGSDLSAEGWFFPDTYYFSRGDSVENIMRRAHAKMVEVLDAEWSQRDAGLPYASAYEALVMASLIEKETGVIIEREQIAGVFVRRLQRRMRLQTDPSVIYGMGARYAGNLTRKDLKTDNAYNTYTRHGLPPAPIAAPGRAAIYAALHPADGSALYFVAKGDGSHFFSDTLDEHLDAVRKYQVIQRRSEYRSAPAQR